MLITPLGKLLVSKNNIPIEYTLTELPLIPIEICNYKVDARYLIEINKSVLNPGDIILIHLDTPINAYKDGGECLVEAMFESDDIFLALGGYDINDNRNSSKCGHNIEFKEKGLKVEILDLKYIQDLLIAISWSSTENDDCYTSVWFSSDPTM